MGQDGVASRPHRSRTSGAGRGRRFLVVLLTVAVTGAACGQRTDDTSPSPVEATDTVPDAPDTGDRTVADGARAVDGERVVVELPPIAPIALPELSTLGAVGDVVADSLGELVAPANGVDVVAAQCREEGGELVFQSAASAKMALRSPDQRSRPSPMVSSSDPAERGRPVNGPPLDGSGPDVPSCR